MEYINEIFSTNKDILYTIHYKSCFLKMENDKYISLADSYIDIEGGPKEVTQFIDDILNEKKDGNRHKIITKKTCKINDKESKREKNN